MLFTTAAFLLLYLPVTLAGFYLLGPRSATAAAAWLFLASLLFYGYWLPLFTILLVASIFSNFAIGRRIVTSLRDRREPQARRWLILGVVFNLGMLAYFKYANFFVDNVNFMLGTDWHPARVVLPIGISFYTFTQIAFLADAHEGKVSEASPIHYGLFVTYFPHLIAGPVLHHSQMMPQFADSTIYRIRGDQFVGGLAIFCLGMFKKVVLADGISPYADAVFGPVDTGAIPGAGEAWIAALCYTLQLYFDFSGYSDMAVGLSWMLNIRLPFNFDSPYQARNISDFWRRWHISLSTFLRDYLYVRLGGNRHGEVRRYANLWVTMLLGGLWHGASWSFVIWGGLHGLYLTLNHGFRAVLGDRLRTTLEARWMYRAACWILTLLAVVVAWVFFRAETLNGAIRIVSAMLTGATPAGEVPFPLFWNAGLQVSTGVGWCLVLGAIALFGRNSNRLGEWVLERLREPMTPAHRNWRPVVLGAVLGGTGMLLVVNLARESVSAFIYFNF